MIPLYDLNPHRRIPWLTVLIILANVAVMAWLSSRNPLEQQLVALQHGFVPKRVSQMGSGQPVEVPVWAVERRGGQQRLRKLDEKRISTDREDVYPTFFTTMFLHGGWVHLLSNMWILWIFGNNVEDRLGHVMYVIYYLIGGLAATFCHFAVDPNSDMPVIGASGAVAAVLGGYAVTYPWAMVRTLIPFPLLIIDIPALIWLGIWFVLQNVIPGLLALRGVVQEPVAYWAHIGGFVAGVALMPLLSVGTSPPGADWRKEADDMFQFNDPRMRSE